MTGLSVLDFFLDEVIHVLSHVSLIQFNAQLHSTISQASLAVGVLSASSLALTCKSICYDTLFTVTLSFKLSIIFSQFSNHFCQSQVLQLLLPPVGHRPAGLLRHGVLYLVPRCSVR